MYYITISNIKDTFGRANRRFPQNKMQAKASKGCDVGRKFIVPWEYAGHGQQGETVVGTINTPPSTR